ncbi:hypothetical protein IWX49DRAFT_273800 [Phyllosticta citricarpa]|uniref:Uncharacterized protein n=2 Tax=Phyllosticta TaxID=121621 RepID=A0ABR1L971_9PEZI
MTPPSFHPSFPSIESAPLFLVLFSHSIHPSIPIPTTIHTRQLQQSRRLVMMMTQNHAFPSRPYVGHLVFALPACPQQATALGQATPPPLRLPNPSWLHLPPPLSHFKSPLPITRSKLQLPETLPPATTWPRSLVTPFTQHAYSRNRESRKKDDQATQTA